MAAGKDEPQPIVLDCAVLVLHLVLLAVDSDELGQTLDAVGDRALAAEPIDRSPPRGHHQPSAGVGRDPIALPRGDRRHERVLDGVLGELEVPDVADQRGQDTGPLLPEGAREGGDRVNRPSAPPAARLGHPACCAAAGRFAGSSGFSTIGRTSTEPHSAIGARAAHFSASSRSPHSRM